MRYEQPHDIEGQPEKLLELAERWLAGRIPLGHDGEGREVQVEEVSLRGRTKA